MNTVLIIIAGIIVVAMTGIGLILKSKEKKINPKKASGIFKTSVIVSGVLFLALVGGVMSSFNTVHAQEKAPQVEQTHGDGVAVTINHQSGAEGMAYIAAAIAVGLGSLGAAIAVGMSAAAAVGAVSENRKVFGNAIVFVGLAEGIAIYGLIIAIMILNRFQ